MVQRKRDAEPLNAPFCNTEKLNAMIRIKSLLTVILALCICYSYGQNLKGNVGLDDSHISSASKGGGSGGLINVDLFTGTGSVSIPIFSQSVNGLNLGVELSYATKGIKVDERASSIGLGFNLEASGSITREVNGLEDEVTMPITSSASHDSLKGRLVSGAFIKSIFNDSSDDMEHDLFHFDLAGRNIDVSFTRTSGSLVYQTYPYSDIKIDVFTVDSGSNSYRSGIGGKAGCDKTHDLLYFVVTDEAGNIFYFERGDFRYKHFSFKSGLYNHDTGTYYPIEKWNLVKIEAANGLVVNYEYKSQYVDFVRDVTETLYPRPQEYDYYTSAVTYDPLHIDEDHWKGIMTHISKITFPNNTIVSFDIDSARCDCRNDFRLKNIWVSRRINPNETDTITFKLNQAYFQTPVYNKTDSEIALNSSCSSMASALTVPSGINTDSARRMYLSRGLRLKLKSIDKIGTDKSTYETIYSFDYNTTALPYRFSAQKDFYGFYNAESPFNWYARRQLTTTGTETFYLSIPYHYDINYYDAINVFTRLSDNYWGAKRTHNFTAAQALSLTGIKTCSGGKDSIVYTPYHLNNRSCSYGNLVLYGYNGTYNSMWYDSVGCYVDSMLQGDTVNDGLCVGKIISTDGFNWQHTTTTEYSYDSSERFNRGGYTSYDSSGGVRIFTNYFISPDNYFNGSNHGFSKVTVTSKGYAGQQLSKQVHYFSNNMFVYNGHDSSSIRRPTDGRFLTIPPDFRKYRVGLPLKSETYDQSNNLISETQNAYEYVAHSPEIKNTKSYGSSYMGIWDYHVIDHEGMRLKSVTTTEHASTRTMVNTVTNTYDSHDNIKRMAVIDSKGDSFRTYTSYNYDYYVANGPNGALNNMNTRGVKMPLVTMRWKMNGSSDSLLLGCSISTPFYDGNLTYPPLRFPYGFSTISKEPLSASHANSTSYINVANAIDYWSNSGYGSALFKHQEETTYDYDYDVVLENKFLNQDLYVSNIYDGNTRRIIAQVNNARYADIAYTSFESDYAASGYAYNEGNLDFNKSNITNEVPAITGTHEYKCVSASDRITSKNLAHKKYLLTFWMNTTYSGAPPVTLGSSALTCTLQNTVGNWKLYSAVIYPTAGNQVELKGVSTGSPPTFYYDEVRLHPIDAAMATYTYKPLFGVANVNNTDNIITYYEYDFFGRPSIIRDMRGKIIKKMEAVCGDSNMPNNGASAPGGDYTKWDYVPNP
jgi:hypothetical protein